MKRGRYFTIPQAVEAYPGVLTERLIRRLVAEKRVAYTYAGRRVVLAEDDIEDYLERNRREPTRGRTGVALARAPGGSVRSGTSVYTRDAAQSRQQNERKVDGASARRLGRPLFEQ